MNLGNIVSLFGMLGGMKDKLLQYGVSPSDLANVNFSNPEEVNKLAEKIMPNIIKSNPGIANQIKQMAGMLGTEKQQEVCQVIDMK